MLTDAKIKAAKGRDKPYRLGDSGQLYLYVSPSGGRHWRMNYSFGRNADGKPLQKTLSFGSYPAVTLLDARAKRDAAKSLLAKGIDPAEDKRAAQQAHDVAARNSFRKLAEEWFELNSGWSLEKRRAWADSHGDRCPPQQAAHWTAQGDARWSAVHSDNVITSLEQNVFPELGKRPIRSIEGRDVLDVLRKVQWRGAIETAHRLRQRISAIFVYGIAVGACSTDVAGGLGTILKKKPPTKPQPSIIDGHHDQDKRITAVRQLLIDCEAERCRPATKLALRFLALTAARPGEVAGARWEEFHDLGGAEPVWVIPASRRKGIRDRKSDPAFDHPVPLSRQAVELLAALRRLTGQYSICFPSDRHVHRQMSENTLRALLIRAGYYQRHVPHGFRAAFSTIMNERPASQKQIGDRAVIDLMLGHEPDDEGRHAEEAGRQSGSELAYNRALYMPRRRELAQDYADTILADFQPASALIGEPMRWASSGPGRP